MPTQRMRNAGSTLVGTEPLEVMEQGPQGCQCLTAYQSPRAE